MLQRYVRYSFGRAYLCTSENPPDFQKIQEQHELTSRINSILRRQKDGNWCTKGICRREAFTSEQPMSFGSNYSCSCEGSVCLFAFGVFKFQSSFRCIIGCASFQYIICRLLSLLLSNKKLFFVFQAHNSFVHTVLTKSILWIDPYYLLYAKQF